MVLRLQQVVEWMTPHEREVIVIFSLLHLVLGDMGLDTWLQLCMMQFRALLVMHVRWLV